MSANMTYEMRILRKTPTTVSTYIRPLTSMSADMTVKDALVGKTVTA